MIDMSWEEVYEHLKKGDLVEHTKERLAEDKIRQMRERFGEGGLLIPKEPQELTAEELEDLKMGAIIPLTAIPAMLAPSADFICEKLAEWFDPPCNWSFDGLGDMGVFMLNHCGEWCADNCGESDFAACWRKLFEVMANEKRLK